MNIYFSCGVLFRVKFLPFIRWSVARKYHLRAPELQRICSDVSEVCGDQSRSQHNYNEATCPIVYRLNMKSPLHIARFKHIKQRDVTKNNNYMNGNPCVIYIHYTLSRNKIKLALDHILILLWVIIACRRSNSLQISTQNISIKWTATSTHKIYFPIALHTWNNRIRYMNCQNGLSQWEEAVHM